MKGGSMLQGNIVSAGIDYISTSMPREAQNAAEWYGKCLTYLQTIARDGNELKSAKRLGYEGWSSGGSFAGERDDSYFCTISGERAQAGFTAVYSRNAHISRLDVQCTIRTDVEDTSTAIRARDAVKVSNAALGGARQRNAILIEDLKGGATCYIGSRASLQFARIYNKEAESKEEQYKNCWRYEVQLKNALATKVAEQFVMSEYNQPSHAATFVRQWIRKRGVKAPWKAEAELYALPTPEKHNSDVETRLTWLREQVQPTIRRLLKLGLRDSILVALGLSDDTTDNV
jgi:Replication initiation factor